MGFSGAARAERRGLGEKILLLRLRGQENFFKIRHGGGGIFYGIGPLRDIKAAVKTPINIMPVTTMNGRLDKGGASTAGGGSLAATGASNLVHSSSSRPF